MFSSHRLENNFTIFNLSTLWQNILKRILAKRFSVTIIVTIMANNVQFSIAVHLLPVWPAGMNGASHPAIWRREHQPQLCAADFGQVVQGGFGWRQPPAKPARAGWGQGCETHFAAGYLPGGGCTEGVFHTRLFRAEDVSSGVSCHGFWQKRRRRWSRVWLKSASPRSFPTLRKK